MNRSLMGRVEERIRRGDTGFFLRAFSLLYGFAVRARLSLYRAGVLRAKALPVPVISIGNLTAGGTGKTPMTMRVAAILKERGMRPVILSRGYKGRHEGVEVVSDGEKVIASQEVSGDEPYLMATRLLGRGVPVVVGRDRYRAGLLAIERFSPDAVILDDGFGHMRLKRDLDILLIDAGTGFGNGRLLPAGPLREPLGSLERAHVYMLKGGGSAPFMDVVGAATRPVFRFSLLPAAMRAFKTNEPLPLSVLEGKAVLALAGIADPRSFYETLEGLGARVRQRLAYPDHHPFCEADARDIGRLSEGIDMVVTTEKDAVRLEALKQRLPEIFVVAVDAVLDDEDGFIHALMGAVRRRG